VHAILDSMDMNWFFKMKSSYRIALVAVLVGGAILLILPLVLGVSNYPLASGDHISSWSFEGAYADNGTNQARTIAEIKNLKAMLGKDKTKDYGLLVGIASQYELLGDGKTAYTYLSRAIAKDHTRGLAYMNMGQLMESLGALATARAAYDAALKAEPASGIYASARDGFYARHPQR
jgi:tetratricopeptide (TPR) repeat protein